MSFCHETQNQRIQFLSSSIGKRRVKFLFLFFLSVPTIVRLWSSMLSVTEIDVNQLSTIMFRPVPCTDRDISRTYLNGCGSLILECFLPNIGNRVYKIKILCIAKTDNLHSIFVRFWCHINAEWAMCTER